MLALVRPLVALRRAAAYDPGFCRLQGPHAPLWPIARAARALGTHDDFPPVEALARVFEGPPPVRFVTASPGRRRGEALEAAALYDARIALEGVVPTRPRCWHDLMNALVWGTFPRAKRALHRRQHRAVSERLAPGTRTLPAKRTRELDALALLDEGGAVVLSRDPDDLRAALRERRAGALRTRIEAGQARALVFGHAIYESLVLGVGPALVAAVVLESSELDASENAGPPDATTLALVREADARLAVAIDDPSRLRTPQDLTRVDLAETSPPEITREGREAQEGDFLLSPS
jgi:hypothetical protein